MAPWQKRFWPKPGSAGSAAVLSALPPQSPPDLHKNTHWTQNMWSVCYVDMVLISRSRNMTKCVRQRPWFPWLSQDDDEMATSLNTNCDYINMFLTKKKTRLKCSLKVKTLPKTQKRGWNVIDCFLCNATVVSCAAHTISGLHYQHTISTVRKVLFPLFRSKKHLSSVFGNQKMVSKWFIVCTALIVL